MGQLLIGKPLRSLATDDRLTQLVPAVFELPRGCGPRGRARSTVLGASLDRRSAIPHSTRRQDRRAAGGGVAGMNHARRIIIESILLGKESAVVVVESQSVKATFVCRNGEVRAVVSGVWPWLALSVDLALRRAPGGSLEEAFWAGNRGRQIDAITFGRCPHRRRTRSAGLVAEVAQTSLDGACLHHRGQDPHSAVAPRYLGHGACLQKK